MNVTELDVYKLGFQFTLEIYKVTEKFPKSELFGLTSQMRRAATSICANLAEGSGRGTTNELKRFCALSKGTTEEVLFYLDLAKELKYLTEEDYFKLSSNAKIILKMLQSLINSLSRRSKNTYH